MYLIILLLLLAGFLYNKTITESFEGDSKYSERTRIVDLGSIKCTSDIEDILKQSSVQEGALGNECVPPNYPSPKTMTNLLNSTKVNSMAHGCKTYHVSNVYYPRYKNWWRYIKDLKTRPEYDQIFPPFWNTHYDPNITSDEYYERVARDNIMPSGRYADQIKNAHDKNFCLRQEMKFAM